MVVVDTSLSVASGADDLTKESFSCSTATAFVERRLGEFFALVGDASTRFRDAGTR